MKNKTKRPLNLFASNKPKQHFFQSTNQCLFDLMKDKEKKKKVFNESNVKPKLQTSQTTKSNHSKYFPSSIEAIQKNSEYDKNILNDSYEKATLDFRPEPMPIKVASTLNSNVSEFENEMDKKLKYVLKTLDLYQFRNSLRDNCISFNDILLLSKNDLIEMGIQLGPRNRILKFAEQYKTYAKDFDFEELKRFFSENRNLVINSIGNNETQDSTIKKKREMDLLKASMDKLCKEMSESSQMVSGYEDKLLHKQQQKNINKNQSLKYQNFNIPDISEIKVNNENVNNHRTRNSNCVNETHTKLNYNNDNKSSEHRRQKSNPNFFKGNQVKTIKRNWTLPKPIFLWNSYTFNQIATLKSSKSIKSNRKQSSLFESNPNLNRKNVFQQRINNQFGKKDKLKQTYQDLFLEIEAYQQKYHNMKIKSDQRNDQINNMLQRTENRAMITHPKQHQYTKGNEITYQSQKSLSSFTTKPKNVNSDSNAMITTKLTDSASIEKMNEILLKKQQLKNTLNECRQSINQKKKIIQRLEDCDDNDNNNGNDDIQYLFNI